MANNKITEFFRNLFNRGKPITEATAKDSDYTQVVKSIRLAFTDNSKQRQDFEMPQGFNFDEIERAYLTDSYIRSAVDRHSDFAFKAGWNFTGKNIKATEYVRSRFKFMAQGTQKPLNIFFNEIMEDLVKYHNVFLLKSRAKTKYKYPSGIKVNPVLSKKPVNGYFIIHPSTIEVLRDQYGNVKQYRQTVAGKDEEIIIKKEDMVHLYIDRQQGRAFGFPFLWEVLDDVKLLRQMEELVDRMVYKNIFPLIIYRVGLAKEGFQAEDGEIEEVKEKMGELDIDGGLILPERHDIEYKGAEGFALDVEKYLEYFQKRVFTGLGVSETLMGRGDTANRSTSDNLDATFKDRIKSYQTAFADFINFFMINEILLEGGFDPLATQDDEVFFNFNEIDFDSKIKEENHAIQKFTQNAITHEELRSELGLDPVTDEARLYFNMITNAVNEAEAIKKADSANNSGANKEDPKNKKESLEDKTKVALLMARCMSSVDTPLHQRSFLSLERRIKKIVESNNKESTKGKFLIKSFKKTLDKNKDSGESKKLLILSTYKQEFDTLIDNSNKLKD